MPRKRTGHTIFVLGLQQKYGRRENVSSVNTRLIISPLVSTTIEKLIWYCLPATFKLPSWPQLIILFRAFLNIHVIFIVFFITMFILCKFSYSSPYFRAYQESCSRHDLWLNWTDQGFESVLLPAPDWQGRAKNALICLPECWLTGQS